MTWKRLDTEDIIAVKFDPTHRRLRAHLKSGMSAEYAPISEQRYSQLIAESHRHDTDTFFRNMIAPFKVSERPTIRFRAKKVVKWSAIAVGVAAAGVFLALLNAGVISNLVDGIFPLGK